MGHCRLNGHGDFILHTSISTFCTPLPLSSYSSLLSGVQAHPVVHAVQGCTGEPLHLARRRQESKNRIVCVCKAHEFADFGDSHASNQLWAWANLSSSGCTGHPC